MSTEFKLIDAVKAGDQAECTRLLELEDIDIYIHERDEDDRSSIVWASRQGHVNIVELLLSKGADINDKDNDGLSSIIEASRCGRECCCMSCCYLEVIISMIKIILVGVL